MDKVFASCFRKRKYRARLNHPIRRIKWEKFLRNQEAMRTFKRSIQGSRGVGDNFLGNMIDCFSRFDAHPAPESYHYLVKFLFRTSRFDHIPAVLDHLEKNETFETPESIIVDLIRLYGTSNRTQDALNLFDRIPKFRCSPSVESLDALLSILWRTSEGLRLVPGILINCSSMNIRLHDSTFKLLITVLCKMKRVGKAIEMFDLMVQYGYPLDHQICSLLLASLCKEKISAERIEMNGFLSKLRKMGFCPGISDYKKLIRFFVVQTMGLKALNILYQMKSDGIKPDVWCYKMVMSGVIEVGDYAKAENLFDEMLLWGLVPSISTYNIYLKGLCKQNKTQEGLKMIANMERLGCLPDSTTYNTLLSWFCKNREIIKAKELAKEMESKGINRNTDFYQIIADGFLEIGEVDDAYAFIDEAFDRGLITSGSTLDNFILMLCQRNLAGKAIDLLEKMISSSTVPNLSPTAKSWEAVIIGSGITFDFAGECCPDCGSNHL